MSTSHVRILLCGHKSFAAQGLSLLLTGNGYSVTNFTRGTVEKQGNTVTGPVDQVHDNPHLEDEYDIVINYILLSDCDIQSNETYLHSLLQLCAERHVRHLIHISSISVYQDNVSLVKEDSSVETNPEKKGAYGSLKVVQDEYLKQHLPSGIKLTLMRPGFILGPGLIDPIVGNGIRAPWNTIVVLGNAKHSIPITTRDIVNHAIINLIEDPPLVDSEVIMLADASSPSKREFLEACCHILGCGMHTISFPAYLWLAAAAGGHLLLRFLGKSDWKVYQKIKSVCRSQRFDPAQSERRLKLDFSVDWKKELKQAMDAQETNFRLPYRNVGELEQLDAQKITFIGFGRIIFQKHLRSLKKLKFSGSLIAYDVSPCRTYELHSVEMVDRHNISSSDLFVVATPGPAHIQSLDILQDLSGKILVEKPLCYSLQELQKWIDFDNSYPQRLFVCHNYRLKQNVKEMISHLSLFNPGRLLNVAVVFQSPPVNLDGAAWLRNERKARTLLMDYSIHWLDLACMFGQGDWEIDSLRYELNATGQTRFIDSHISCETYSVHLLLRQGFIPRKANIHYTFQNYSVSLSFFPDIFVPHMVNDNYWLHKKEAKSLWRGTRQRIRDKLLSNDSDLSHAYTYQSVLGNNLETRQSLSFGALQNFYDVILRLADSVYGT